MIYVYCPRPDEGVRSLAVGLKAKLVTCFDGLNFWSKRDRLKIGIGDVLVCWGEPIPKLEGIKMLNGCDNPMSDLQAVWHLKVNGGWSTIRLDRSQDMNPAKAKVSEFIPRSLKHRSGDDLLLGTTKADFWIKQSDCQNQWRCHVLNKKMVRCGVKVPQPGTVVTTSLKWKPGVGLLHPWVRTELGGWMIDYSEPKPGSTMKSFAVGVVESLGLDICAVDIGQTSLGDLILLNVNYAPDLPDQKSVDGYVSRIERWIKGASDEGDETTKSGKGAKVARF